MLHLDHAVIFVRDLDRAAPLFRRLGFTTSPRAVHQGLGTANHTIMLERTYFELLTVLEPMPGNSRWASILERREGFGGVAFGTRDARATRATLVERGLAVPEPVDFGRVVPRPDGPVTARFTVAHLPPESSPVLPAFFCQHHTPEHVWLPELTTHPNSAFHLAGMTVAHPDPEGVAIEYERLLGRASVHPHPGGVALDLRGSRLWIVRPDFASARMGTPVTSDPAGLPVGLTFLVHDLNATRTALSAGGVPFTPFGRSSVAVSGPWTSDVHLEFLAA